MGYKRVGKGWRKKPKLYGYKRKKGSSGIYPHYKIQKIIKINQIKKRKLIAKKNTFKMKKSWWKNKGDNNFVSRGEKKLRVVVKQMFSNQKIIFNDKKKLTFAELDIYLPKLKLAFEYNGLQHYQFVPKFHDTMKDKIKQKVRDEDKKWQCKEKGITLIIIKYDEKIDENTIKSKMDMIGYNSKGITPNQRLPKTASATAMLDTGDRGFGHSTEA